MVEAVTASPFFCFFDELNAINGTDYWNVKSSTVYSRILRSFSLMVSASVGLPFKPKAVLSSLMHCRSDLYIIHRLDNQNITKGLKYSSAICIRPLSNGPSSLKPMAPASAISNISTN